MHPGHQVVITAPNASVGGGLVFCCVCQVILPKGEAYVINFEDWDVCANAIIEQRNFFACSREHAQDNDREERDRSLAVLHTMPLSSSEKALIH